MEILGHSQISITMNTYTHVDPELNQNRHRPDGGGAVADRLMTLA